MRSLAPLVLCLGLFLAVVAAAAPIKVALLSGDGQSAAAIGAITELRRDAAVKEVVVRVFPQIELTDEDRQFVRGSDIVIGYTRYGALMRALAPEIRATAERGALLAGVGGPLDPEFAELGFKRDAALAAYMDAGGQANLVQMVRAALARKHVPALKFTPPSAFPEFGYFDPASRRAFARFDEYATNCLAGKAERRGRPVGGRILFSRDNATSGQTELLSALDAALNARGFNGLFGFGYPGDAALPALFLDTNHHSRVEALIGLTLKIGNVPDKLGPCLAQLDVPILNGIALNSQSRPSGKRRPAVSVLSNARGRSAARNWRERLPQPSWLPKKSSWMWRRARPT